MYTQKGGKSENPECPNARAEIYEMIKKVWKDQNFRSMADYLEYYNCLDVKPLHETMEKMIRFYAQHRIDLLREVLTLSGAAKNSTWF